MLDRPKTVLRRQDAMNWRREIESLSGDALAEYVASGRLDGAYQVCEELLGDPSLSFAPAGVRLGLALLESERRVLEHLAITAEAERTAEHTRQKQELTDRLHTLLPGG